MAKIKSDKLTVKHMIGYGCGDCGGMVFMWMGWSYMSRFLQVHLQINAVVLATMLLIWNIWDAVNDPMMGTIMDMCYAKAKPGKDKFRPWVLASIPVLCIGSIGLFAIPQHLGGGWMMVAVVFMLKIIYEGGYTMVNIAMGSLLGNMAKNDNERATLASARGFGSTFASLIAGFVVPLVIDKFGDNPDGYLVGTIVCAILGSILVFMHYAWTEERNKTAPSAVEKTAEEKEAEKIKVTDIFNIITKNRAFLALVLHSICICAVQALGQGAALYMYADVIGDIGMQAYYNTITSVLMIVILSAAPLLTKKWDLVLIIRTCLLAGFATMAALLAYTIMIPDFNAWLFVIVLSIGEGLITMSVQMQWGLVAEAIDYNEYLSGKRNEGTIYGFFSLSRRIGSTIANSGTVLMIAAIGYDAALTAAGVAQSAGTIAGIKIMTVGFPCIAALGSWACFTFIWNINKDVRAKMAAWKEAKAV